jgi:hypothetical protein
VIVDDDIGSFIFEILGIIDFVLNVKNAEKKTENSRCNPENLT